MDHYLLIESRDPFESNDVSYYYELTKGLVGAGNEVTSSARPERRAGGATIGTFRRPVRAGTERREDPRG